MPAFHVNSAGQVAILTNQFSRTLNIGGDLEADKFYGDGSNLTGVGGIVTAGSITSEKIATSAVNSSKLSTNIEIDGYLSVGGTILKTLSSIALGEQSNTHVNLGSDSITGSVGVSNLIFLLLAVNGIQLKQIIASSEVVILIELVVPMLLFLQLNE